MLTFLYWVCALIGAVYFVLEFDKARNKLQPMAGFILSFVPIINFAIAILVIKRNWPTLVKLWNKLV